LSAALIRTNIKQTESIMIIPIRNPKSTRIP
jgi:hypothetical protein